MITRLGVRAMVAVGVVGAAGPFTAWALATLARLRSCPPDGFDCDVDNMGLVGVAFGGLVLGYVLAVVGLGVFVVVWGRPVDPAADHPMSIRTLVRTGAVWVVAVCVFFALLGRSLEPSRSRPLVAVLAGLAVLAATTSPVVRDRAGVALAVVLGGNTLALELPGSAFFASYAAGVLGTAVAVSTYGYVPAVAGAGREPHPEREIP